MAPATVLTKGANAPVVVSQVHAVISWTAAPGAPDVDASALLLTAAGKVRSDGDFVFYNQPAHTSGAVRHTGRTTAGPLTSDTLTVDLDALVAEVDRVVLGASAEGGTFGQVPNLSLSVTDRQGRELLRFAITEAAEETAFLFGEFYRRQGQWKLRAVGQGYDSGLAGLATDFGITVDEEPAPPTTQRPALPGPAARPVTRPASPASAAAARTSPSPVTPAGAAQVRLTKGEERLPVDMRKRLSLRKQQVAVSLLKHGASDVTARVVLVLDASGSMTRLYDKGVVDRVVERMAAVAAQLDDDGQLQAWTFASTSAQLPDLNIGDLPAWLGLHVRCGEIAMFNRRKQLAPGQVDMRAVGIQNEEQKVIADVRRYVQEHPIAAPTLVLFFSDGGVYRNKEIEQELRAAVTEPIFWQFVGLGRAGFGVLERLDTMSGRLVDNVGFFAVNDIEKVSDENLYDRLLSEFPAWLKAASAAGVLRT